MHYLINWCICIRVCVCVCVCRCVCVFVGVCMFLFNFSLQLVIDLYLSIVRLLCYSTIFYSITVSFLFQIYLLFVASTNYIFVLTNITVRQIALVLVLCYIFSRLRVFMIIASWAFSPFYNRYGFWFATWLSFESSSFSFFLFSFFFTVSIHKKIEI